MDIENTMNKLWQSYQVITPSANRIKKLFESQGELVNNDHIAFRTFNDPKVNIDKLASAFVDLGYEPKQEYYFEKKKLNAKHYEHADDKLPRIFISELILEDFSPFLKETISKVIDSIPANALSGNLLFSGRMWDTPSYKIYDQLREESEYAAWLYLYGFIVNHFTVNINELKAFDSVEEVNDFLKHNGFKLNSSGGEVKGRPSDLLQQSSTIADRIKYGFIEGEKEVPGGYYEFAKRYEENGKLFNGFITNSADKIFESTDKSLQ